MQPSLQMLHAFYGYNKWANQRILDTAAQLNAEQFVANVGMSFPSVRDTLVHTMSVESQWIASAKGLETPRNLPFDDYKTLEEIRAQWAKVDADTQAFVQQLSEADLAQNVRYRNDRDDIFNFALWQVLLHQVNHATQHRSEVAVMLTQFGFSPGWIDFVVYVSVSRAQ